MDATNWPKSSRLFKRPLMTSWVWICLSSFSVMKESIKAIVGCFAIFLKVLISTNHVETEVQIQQSESS
ncbi:hypothetical protein Csa_008649, partial [Cucumis sativus]